MKCANNPLFPALVLKETQNRSETTYIPSALPTGGLQGATKEEAAMGLWFFKQIQTQISIMRLWTISSHNQNSVQ